MLPISSDPAPRPFGRVTPHADHAVAIRFHRLVLLPGEVQLLTCAPDSSGQFSLLGADQQMHMSGS